LFATGLAEHPCKFVLHRNVNNKRMKKYITITTLLLILSGFVFAQNSEFSTEPRKETKQISSIKERKSWKKDFGSTVSKHTISIDIMPFFQKLDLDASLFDNNGDVALPNDAKSYGSPFFRKLKPWKILYKYNLKHNSNTALFLRVGLLGFCKSDHKEDASDDVSKISEHRSLDILFASYGLFAGIEKSYSLISTLSFNISADFGYYFSNIRHQIIQPVSYNSDYKEDLGLWAIDQCSEIQTENDGAHSFFVEPSIQLEYTFLKTISLGIAANINFRYYSEKLISHKIKYLYKDGKLEDRLRNYGGWWYHIPRNENHFSVNPTFSIYISYKF
jgi:hypothetical protein